MATEPEYDFDFPDRPMPFWLVCILGTLLFVSVFIGALSLFQIILGVIQ